MNWQQEELYLFLHYHLSIMVHQEPKMHQDVRARLKNGLYSIWFPVEPNWVEPRLRLLRFHGATTGNASYTHRDALELLKLLPELPGESLNTTQKQNHRAGVTAPS